VSAVRAARLGLVSLSLGFGVAVEWVFYDESLGLPLTAADFTVGCLLIVCGGLAWERQPRSGVGALLTLAGFSWFVGNLGGAAVYFHRGPLAHVVLAYPSGRVRDPLIRAVVVFAYVDALVEPLASNDELTLVLAGAIAAAAAWTFVRTSGPARLAGSTSLAAALAFSGVLALGAVDRLAGAAHDRAVLWAYDAVIASVAVVLAADLVRGRSVEATVRELVVDLGAASGTAGLRARLARALGDPSLVLGYRLPESEGFVDDAGRMVALPAPGSERTMTRLEDGGEEIGVLVHDEQLSADRKLVESVAAAARIAMANVRLQTEAHERATELEASRRRIVETTDRQRRRLEEDFRLGPERLLESAAARLAAAARSDETGGFALLEHELAEVRHELRELAQGIHPSVLSEGGLMPALELLAEHSAVPVRVHGRIGRLPGHVEAALYFVCSEGLANAVKHSHAAEVAIEVGEADGLARVTVVDDGVGGATVGRGSGLSGLSDRIEALGGTLGVESPGGAGTKLVAEIPTRR